MFRPCFHFSQAMEKVLPVIVRFKYLLSFDAPNHYVMDGISGVYSCASRHAFLLAIL